MLWVQAQFVSWLRQLPSNDILGHVIMARPPPVHHSEVRHLEKVCHVMDMLMSRREGGDSQNMPALVCVCVSKCDCVCMYMHVCEYVHV